MAIVSGNTSDMYKYSDGEYLIVSVSDYNLSKHVYNKVSVYPHLDHCHVIFTDILKQSVQGFIIWLRLENIPGAGRFLLSLYNLSLDLCQLIFYPKVAFK